jgi:hypothetical protein
VGFLKNKQRDGSASEPQIYYNFPPEEKEFKIYPTTT